MINQRFYHIASPLRRQNQRFCLTSPSIMVNYARNLFLGVFIVSANAALDSSCGGVEAS